MRGKLLRLVKSMSAFKDLRLLSILPAGPLSTLSGPGKSTLSELDKSVVHPDVRKETDICQEKGNKCP